jgi:hypothetical protein
MMPRWLSSKPADQFNRVLWKGMMGSKPYPKLRGVTQKVASRGDD